jgi:hypothetical protein
MNEDRNDDAALSNVHDSSQVSWEELERSALDSDKEVRENALARLMVTNHDEDTIEWYLWLLAEVIERYADGQAAISLLWLSTRSAEWFGMTWNTANTLLELDNPEVTQLLTIGYFEVVLREDRGPDDPRVRAWIEGDDVRKKRVLLEVADWLGLDAGRLWEIVAAMANDKDNEVAERARKMLGTDQT